MKDEEDDEDGDDEDEDDEDEDDDDWCFIKKINYLIYYDSSLWRLSRKLRKSNLIYN